MNTCEQQCTHLLTIFRYDNKAIPEYMHPGIADYLCNHQAPGDFLSAVLRNDLYRAVGQADDTNINLLPVYVAFLYKHAPASSWGSEYNFKQWLLAK